MFGSNSLLFPFLFVVIIAIVVHPLSATLAQEPNALASCNCVVFRMDDIQDYFAADAQIAAMNFFMSKGQPLSLAIIMNATGEESDIIEKVREGAKSGLFELGIHGWAHVDYAKIPESEQKSTLQMSNNKMMKMFGNTSDIFVEPYGHFNNNTIKAMEELKFKISSATMSSEIDYDGGKSIFNFTNSRAGMVPDNIKNASSHKGNTTIYHIPDMVAFMEYQNSKPTKVPINNILSTIDDNIKKYGYSIVVIHPEDLMQRDESGKVTESNTVNSMEFQDFTRLLDAILSKNFDITTLSEIVGIQPRIYS